MFSPHLTDCSIPLSRISNKRITKIIPIGGIDLIDEDSWRNVRRRNKKFSFRWIGKTEFTILSVPTPDGDGAVVADFPAMPVCLDGQEQHRDKLNKPLQLSEEDVHDAIAMVARPVGKKELFANPKAQASLDIDWEKLMKKKAWDMLSVREWDDVSREAKKKNKKVHVGKVFEICVEKGSETPANDPLRKFKGRTVFQGNNVNDKSSEVVLFSELGSSPATMEAGKVLDAYGHTPANTCQQADGKQA